MQLIKSSLNPFAAAAYLSSFAVNFLFDDLTICFCNKEIAETRPSHRKPLQLVIMCPAGDHETRIEGFRGSFPTVVMSTNFDCNANNRRLLE